MRFACFVLVCFQAFSRASASSAAARPTTPQVAYQQHEIMALIHFNMATMAHDGDPGCSAENWNKKASYAVGPTSDPATFNPAKLNVSNWVESIKNVGAKHAVLTAKHGCGFLLWPTKVTLPDGRPYRYDVTTFGRNVVREFSEAMALHGVGHGFYYSLKNNFYLNTYMHKVLNTSLLPGQEKVTQEQYEELALAQVTELWRDFGNLTELWFDGGIRSDEQTRLKKLLAKLQPSAVAFDGAGISPHPVCWVGTESGLPKGGGIWSAGWSDTGDPTSPIFCPKGCDTTLQHQAWFYEEQAGVRSLSELVEVYHATVGENCVLELDIAVDRDGLVAPAHAVRYKQLGDYIESCYGSDNAAAMASGNPGQDTITIAHLPHRVDRVVLQEDIRLGQLVLSFQILAQARGGEWELLASSDRGIGNKKIVRLPTEVTAGANLRVQVTNKLPSSDGSLPRSVTVTAVRPEGCVVPWASTEHDRASEFVV